jgi:histidinol-phosphate aminotransferase
MIRLHLNENPFVSSEYNRYPDDSYLIVRRRLKEFYNIKNSEVLVGNGSTELISAIFLWAKLQGKEIVFPWPSYILYQELDCIYNIKAKKINVCLRAWDLEQIAIEVPENALLVLCNPNNPTGTFIPKHKLKELFANIPSSTTILLDEAYIEFIKDELKGGFAREVDAYRNLIVVRTFSKYFGLAGLRIGYAILSGDYYKQLRPFLQLWNVNSLAEKEAIMCLRDVTKYEEKKQESINLRDQYQQIFHENGFSILPSETNFLCITHPCIETITERWMENGFLVNRLASYKHKDLAGYIRISIEREKEMNKLLKLLS